MVFTFSPNFRSLTFTTDFHTGRSAVSNENFKRSWQRSISNWHNKNLFVDSLPEYNFLGLRLNLPPLFSFAYSAQVKSAGSPLTLSPVRKSEYIYVLCMFLIEWSSEISIPLSIRNSHKEPIIEIHRGFREAVLCSRRKGRAEFSHKFYVSRQTKFATIRLIRPFRCRVDF